MDFERMPRFKNDVLAIVCKVPEWAVLFEVDVLEIERQIGLAHGWADANPKRAPKKNVLRYLYNWMGLAQRRGSLLKGPRKSFKEHRPNDEDIMSGDDFKRMVASIPTLEKGSSNENQAR